MKKLTYATKRIEALRTPATPSKYVLHAIRLKPGTKVVLYGRASTRSQKNSPEEQIAGMEAGERGWNVVAEVKAITSRNATEPTHRNPDGNYQLERAISIARKHGAVVVAQDVSRFKGCFAVKGEDGNYTQIEMPLNVRSYRELMEMADGVQLATIVHPDATLAEIKSYRSKRGQAATGSKGGRPPVASLSRMQERKRKLFPQVIKLWQAKWSRRDIGKKLKIHHTTAQLWIQEFKLKKYTL